jgi:hypothetical protein
MANDTPRYGSADYLQQKADAEHYGAPEAYRDYVKENDLAPTREEWGHFYHEWRREIHYNQLVVIPDQISKEQPIYSPKERAFYTARHEPGLTDAEFVRLNPHDATQIDSSETRQRLDKDRLYMSVQQKADADHYDVAKAYRDYVQENGLTPTQQGWKHFNREYRRESLYDEFVQESERQGKMSDASGALWKSADLHRAYTEDQGATRASLGGIWRNLAGENARRAHDDLKIIETPAQNRPPRFGTEEWGNQEAFNKANNLGTYRSDKLTTEQERQQKNDRAAEFWQTKVDEGRQIQQEQQVPSKEQQQTQRKQHKL